ncbi:MAG TPA: hypothetical protein VK066_02750 [Chloroflexota bacterium]|nr:hypothetical protein [Chloroflexota bacterium]
MLYATHLTPSAYAALELGLGDACELVLIDDTVCVDTDAATLATAPRPAPYRQLPD